MSAAVQSEEVSRKGAKIAKGMSFFAIFAPLREIRLAFASHSSAAPAEQEGLTLDGPGGSRPPLRKRCYSAGGSGFFSGGFGRILPDCTSLTTSARIAAS